MSPYFTTGCLHYSRVVGGGGVRAGAEWGFVAERVRHLAEAVGCAHKRLAPVRAVGVAGPGVRSIRRPIASNAQSSLRD